MIRIFLTLLWIECKNILRTRVVLFWTLLFPVFLLTVMIAAFGQGGLGNVGLDVVDLDASPESRALLAQIDRTFASGDPLTLLVRPVAADAPVEKGRLKLTIPKNFGNSIAASVADVVLTYDQEGAASVRTAGRMIYGAVIRYGIDSAGSPPPVRLIEQHAGATAKRLSYREYILTGILVMSIMSTGILTTAVTLSSAREVNAFKALACLPLSRTTYIGAVAVSRLVLMLCSSALLLAIGWVFFDVQIPLRPALSSLTVIASGGLMFLTLGVLLGARAPSAGAATMLGNLVYFPLLFLGDLTIPLNDFPSLARELLSLLPVHSVVTALRSILFQGGSLQQQGELILITLVWSAAFLLLARLLFRWQKYD